jgi:hypothetical protein
MTYRANRVDRVDIAYREDSADTADIASMPPISRPVSPPYPGQ